MIPDDELRRLIAEDTAARASCLTDRQREWHVLTLRALSAKYAADLARELLAWRAKYPGANPMEESCGRNT